MNDKTRIGNKIRELRIERKMSQKELASKSGLSVNSIQNFEYGTFTPKAESIEKISKALDISPFDLMSLAYYDLKIDTESLAKEVKQFSTFEKYLNSLGFTIEQNVTWHYENSDEPDPSERILEVDDVKYTLSRNGQKAVFTAEEYNQLQTFANDVIEGQFYKKIYNQK